MTTLIPFTPSSGGPFQFQPILDGNTYTAFVTSNLSGNRYYVNLYDLNGNWIFTLPLIGSDAALTLASLTWAIGVVTATTELEHGYAVGSTIKLTISGAVADSYNGTVLALITGPMTFTYPIPTVLDDATIPGTVNYNINMAAGYFQSTMVFRQAAQTFEISP